MTKKDFRKNFPFLAAVTSNLDYYVNGQSDHGYKTERGYMNFLQHLEDSQRYALTANTDIYLIEIDVVWKKSRAWGKNPYATVRIYFKNNGVREYYGYASGCNYDKLSSAIAEALNQGARQLLFKKKRTIKNAPYGVDQKGYTYEGGVGISCYQKIANWLGATWKEIRRPNFDYFAMEF